jgi:hypothetical protein
VQGEPITAHAAKQALPTAARLRLFLQVLQAVQHAHAQLVIHRDIKPANVLVDERGQVKLLDFGVAKLLDDDGATQDTELTRLGGRAMTPQYASPEQVAGHALGTASDVYSLGAALRTAHRPAALHAQARHAGGAGERSRQLRRPVPWWQTRPLGALRGDFTAQKARWLRCRSTATARRNRWHKTSIVTCSPCRSWPGPPVWATGCASCGRDRSWR